MQIIINSHIILKKSEMPRDMIKWVKSLLTFKNPDYIGAAKFAKNKWALSYIPEFIYGYTENEEGYLLIDRGFLNSIIKYCQVKNITIEIDDQTIVREANLGLKAIQVRKYQKRACNAAQRASNGVILAPCGAGKTRIMLKIAEMLNQHTLILVNTNFIMSQWINYYKELYGYDIGVIQGDIVDIKPITIAMIPTLYERKLTDKFVNKWGLVIIDEAHHTPAQTLHYVLNSFPARYRFGTTATARRTDGLDNLIFSSLGRIIYRISATTLAKLGYIQIPRVELIKTDFHSSSRKYNAITDQLIKSPIRNRLIIENLIKNSNRFNLVISNRLEHLELLSKMYSKHTNDFAVVTGAVKPEQREEFTNAMRRGELHTIFATNLADEGLDIPILDTLHMVFPTKADGRIEQRIGRIQRAMPNKEEPLVYDYQDPNVVKLQRFDMFRERLYRELELKVEGSIKWYSPKNKKEKTTKSKQKKNTSKVAS